MKKGKVVLVGTGFVGMSMAYSMLNQGGVNELVLIDIDKDKTKGEEMDMAHGLPYAPQKMVIKAGEYDECKEDFSPHFMDYLLNLDRPIKEIESFPSNILLIEIKENPYYVEEKSERFRSSRIKSSSRTKRNPKDISL